MDSKTSAEIRSKTKVTRLEYAKYCKLLEYGYMSEIYKDLNAGRLSDPVFDKPKTPEERNSNIAQYHLLNLAFLLSSDESYPKYFCASQPNCRTPERRIESPGARWGGANEFEALRSYKSFVDDNLADLGRVAAAIPNEGYFVETQHLEEYDFEKEGFPISLNFFWNDVLPLKTNSSVFHFTPIHDYEKGLGHQPDGRLNKFDSILAIPIDEAEAAINRTGRKIFVVYKIKFNRYEGEEELRFNGKPLTFAVHIGYHLTSPVVEFFEDEALTKKIGEVVLHRRD